MGLVLDSSALIAAERAGLNYAAVIRELSLLTGDANEACVVSAITVAELAHGIARARTELQRVARRQFVDDLLLNVAIQPVTVAIAYRAGIIDGELAAKGLHPGLIDVIIGTTAIELDYRVATANTRHFAMIPGLQIVTV